MTPHPGVARGPPESAQGRRQASGRARGSAPMDLRGGGTPRVGWGGAGTEAKPSILGGRAPARRRDPRRATLLAAAGAALFSMRADTEYEATAAVVVHGVGAPTQREDQVAQRRARSPALARRGLDQSGLSRLPAAAFLDHSDARIRDEGGVALTVRGSRSSAVMHLADSYARELAATLRRRGASRALVLPTREAKRDQRQPLLGAALGAAIGLPLGLILIMLREALDLRPARAASSRSGSGWRSWRPCPGPLRSSSAGIGWSRSRTRGARKRMPSRPPRRRCFGSRLGPMPRRCWSPARWPRTALRPWRRTWQSRQRGWGAGSSSSTSTPSAPPCAGASRSGGTPADRR